jgi:hypothetical protein
VTGPGSPRRRAVTAFLILAIVSLTLPRRAFAYIDPGAGTYALQVIFALVLGGLASGRARLAELFRRLRGFVRRGP